MQSSLANLCFHVNNQLIRRKINCIGSSLFSSLVRKRAPEFSNKKAVVDGQISSISSTDLAGSYWVMLFYPLDFTFVCPTELTAFNDRISEFEALGVKVLAASVDSEYSHLAWTKLPRKEGGLGPMRIPLLADVDKTLSSSFGVLLDSGVALRGLFIVDKQGIVRQSTINDLPIGRSVDEAIRLIQAVQFTDANGEGKNLRLPC
ncbi:Peroxiredoxin-2 [Mitosporidium daphniae]